MTDRRSRILDGLDIRNLEGVEIGALCWPIVNKSDGSITYVDHADTETLREKYGEKHSESLEQIVDVDVVAGNRTLPEALGPDRRFDYVVASHVIEHVPDLIGWLNELAAVLKENGDIRLAVPDKRFTFDFRRQNSQLADVMAAYVVQARVPQPQQIFDFQSNFAELDARDGWRSHLPDLASPVSFGNSVTWMAVAREATNNVYHDVHCWVFTPESFATLFYEMALLGFHSFECHIFHDTVPDEYEFIVALKHNADKDCVLESWLSMAAAATAAGSSSAQLEEMVDFTDRSEQDLEGIISALRFEVSNLQGELDRREATN
jgi:SAM-dependent methyltransferase